MGRFGELSPGHIVEVKFNGRGLLVKQAEHFGDWQAVTVIGTASSGQQDYLLVNLREQKLSVGQGTEVR